MIIAQSSRQRGAVLLVALVMLLVLTLLAVGSMSGVALESRVTGNRVLTVRMQNSAEAALREAEFRINSPETRATRRQQLEPHPAECKVTNVLQGSGFNKTCLLAIKDTSLHGFVKYPQNIKNNDLSAASAGSLLWMPYRGLDYIQASIPEIPSFWNTYILAPESVAYGDYLQGKSTYYYLVNGLARPVAGRDLAVQSTMARFYFGEESD
ncbi:pilus assembly protein PilX [Pseudomonas sp. PDM16]|uniref:pilus assembly protein PilX n=1 Tax=Pseudomonas sp. PDM16 TaxID=2769292 RepID=UPI00177F2623|nr:pilus assembly protein PilX [Pseudomonas sp. PDM16]MBD9415625.1 pilus assembly protein PilX [Pseudomonas sp. PDM16]